MDSWLWGTTTKSLWSSHVAWSVMSKRRAASIQAVFDDENFMLMLRGDKKQVVSRNKQHTDQLKARRNLLDKLNGIAKANYTKYCFRNGIPSSTRSRDDPAPPSGCASKTVAKRAAKHKRRSAAQPSPLRSHKHRRGGSRGQPMLSSSAAGPSSDDDDDLARQVAAAKRQRLTAHSSASDTQLRTDEQRDHEHRTQRDFRVLSSSAHVGADAASRAQHRQACRALMARLLNRHLRHFRTADKLCAKGYGHPPATQSVAVLDMSFFALITQFHVYYGLRLEHRDVLAALLGHASGEDAKTLFDHIASLCFAKFKSKGVIDDTGRRVKAWERVTGIRLDDIADVTSSLLDDRLIDCETTSLQMKYIRDLRRFAKQTKTANVFEANIARTQIDGLQKRMLVDYATPRAMAHAALDGARNYREQLGINISIARSHQSAADAPVHPAASSASNSHDRQPASPTHSPSIASARTSRRRKRKRRSRRDSSASESESSSYSDAPPRKRRRRRSSERRRRSSRNRSSSHERRSQHRRRSASKDRASAERKRKKAELRDQAAAIRQAQAAGNARASDARHLSHDCVPDPSISSKMHKIKEMLKLPQVNGADLDAHMTDHTLRGQKGYSPTYCLAREHGAFVAATVASISKPVPSDDAAQLKELANVLPSSKKKKKLKSSKSIRDEAVAQCQGVTLYCL